jgi:hypothetical protein
MNLSIRQTRRLILSPLGAEAYSIANADENTWFIPRNVPPQSRDYRRPGDKKVNLAYTAATSFTVSSAICQVVDLNFGEAVV